MEPKKTALETYAAPLRWSTHFKRLFFEAPDKRIYTVAFEAVSMLVLEASSSIETWSDFLKYARKQYRDRGFTEIMP